MRAISRDNSSVVSLFPFLAVLLCTMGALIVLLVVIARQARLEAAQQANAPDNAHLADMSAKLNDQIEMLQQSQQRTRENLKNDRLTLSHLEEHLWRLRERVVELQAAAKQLEEAQALDEATRQRAEAEVQRLRKLIDETRQVIAEQREEASQRRPSYAVVPYRGQNATTRRPIYIECLRDSVVIQPEGIVLHERDFIAPLGPGNPLAAALRAASEYWAQQATATGDELAEPYPLILVRPEGIGAYYRVRDAVESWADNFGYELIEQDWELSFPPVDPQLAHLQERAIREARLRRVELARAAPSRYGSYSSAGGATGEVGETTGRGSAGSPAGELGASGRGAGEGSSFLGPGSFAARRAEQASDGTGSGDSSEGSAGMQASDGANPTTTADSAAGGEGPSSPAEGSPSQPSGGTPGDTADASSDTAAQAEGGTGGPNSFGADTHVAGPGGTSSNIARPLSDQRGADWALSKESQRAVPISRPVKVVCSADHLAILSSDTNEVGQKIPLTSPTADAVDDFIAALWEHTAAWGIAGDGLYWRPTIVLIPDPSGQRRADDLETLLKGSGLPVKQRTSP